jgi:branched-chain amino acid transport system substrate-binding protein
MKRRQLMTLAATAALATGLATGAFAQETLKIGAVAPKTGPLAGGAAVTYWPNVQLWANDVNARGGLDVGGTKMMIEIIEYDDQTNPGQTIAAVQRLATQDGADFILPPYSTGLNLAAAPIYARFEMPMVTSTATTDQVEEITAQFPNVFISLGGASGMAQGAVDVLSACAKAATSATPSRWSTWPTPSGSNWPRPRARSWPRPASTSSTTPPIRSARRTFRRS